MNEPITAANEPSIQGLNRLHDSASRIDNDLDTYVLGIHRCDSSLTEITSKYAMTSLRHVWSEVRDGLDRERQVRDNFRQALEDDVVDPLTVFKVRFQIAFILTFSSVLGHPRTYTSSR